MLLLKGGMTVGLPLNVLRRYPFYQYVEYLTIGIIGLLDIKKTLYASLDY
jgi:hypothetical protein